MREIKSDCLDIITYVYLKFSDSHTCGKNYSDISFHMHQYHSNASPSFSIIPSTYRTDLLMYENIVYKKCLPVLTTKEGFDNLGIGSEHLVSVRFMPTTWVSCGDRAQKHLMN